ncbi:MAG: asparagine synthase C-terminal domain-containing protein [Candidatus Woesearchaeota archaeon]
MIEQFEAGKLPAQKDWETHIDELRKKTIPSTKEDVMRALVMAIEKRVPKKRFGLWLSGGVDSSLLAVLLKKFTDNFTCYNVGIKGSKDLAAAKELAKRFKLDLIYREYSEAEVEGPLKKTAQILKNDDCVAIGVASVVVAATELANVKTFFGGLGSEEIFAGYERHEKAADINEECWRGLKAMWKRDLVRDAAVAKALGISVKVPFLDDDLIKAAMGIPGERKVNSDNRKIILREIAEELGLPKELAWRPKQAAQYGSGFDKAMRHLAHKKGMKQADYAAYLI